MNVSDTRLCLLLHSVPQLSDALLARLFLHYGCPNAVVASNFQEWSILGASEDVISGARSTFESCGKRNPIDVDAQLECLARLSAQVLCLTDEAYPALLRTIYDPPPLLYVRGNAELLQQAQIAVVGSRKASPAGCRAARTLSCELVAAGLHICSGLAQGIDGEAHRAALSVGGGSVAVMATGIDIVYPVRHRELAEQLANSGALVTEYPPGCKPERYRFPRRNRILSGLSLGVLVVEAALRSGTLITAGAALEQGREVFALPWSMFHEGGRGCLRLIGDGAKMVAGVEGILDELGPLYDVQQALLLDTAPGETETDPMPAGLRRVLALVGYEAVGVDELVLQSALPVARVMAALSALELEGFISRCPGGYIHS